MNHSPRVYPGNAAPVTATRRPSDTTPIARCERPLPARSGAQNDRVRDRQICMRLQSLRKAEAMETSATFRLFGRRDLTAAAVTDHLGVTPSRSFEAGIPVSRRSMRLRESSGWLLHSAPAIEVGVELSEQIERLLSVLEPKAQSLWELVERGYQANWFCYLGSHAAEHAAELNRDLLARLLHLPGDLWIDASGDAEKRS
jgi:Domain of unknown function (DUF4279)